MSLEIYNAVLYADYKKAAIRSAGFGIVSLLIFAALRRTRLRPY